ncbi:MAG: acetyl-CoA acetyltransferase [Deltaproteobacteria bacterium]|nr:acetyl-CoA acetyltransferase [Deltaproteobacteria bacterium]MBI3078744.1 acetyl-CoA acetyltransferase [Deltaproteobacteria bacterium]
MGLRDRVAIVGAGCTRFGENFGQSYTDMLVEACHEAFAEAGIGPKDVQAAWLGTAFPDVGVYKGRSGMDLAEPLGLFDIPITRVSNYCATGADALRNACLALLSGEHRVVLAAGVEKLRDRAPVESIVKLMVETGHPFLQKGLTAAGTFAMYAVRHFETYGLTREDLALVSVKNHRHAVNNPKAHHRREVTVEQVLKAPMVSYPLGLLDCCPTTDGAAAVVLVRTEDARRLNPDHVLIKGLGFAVSTGWDLPFFDARHDFLGFRAAQVAARHAYEDTGVRDPLREIDLAEVHDCFSIVELLTYEDLGFCKPGQAKELLREGRTALGGDLPVNVSGGLLSCGHPVGATGLRMIHELTRQLQDRAGARQVPNARLGLAHNIGGPGAVSSVTILGRA